jgi:hypothetical protein
MYTHWACFDCRKSFSKDESSTPRKCPECTRPMTDMGAYFEPPRKAAVKLWQVMKLIADKGLRFSTKDAKVYIDTRILVVRNPRLADVIERIDDEQRRKAHAEGTNDEN